MFYEFLYSFYWILSYVILHLCVHNSLENGIKVQIITIQFFYYYYFNMGKCLLMCIVHTRN